jgi:hypothetical protein
MQLFQGILVAGVALFAAAMILPLVRVPQTLTTEGPAVPYRSIQYAISGYGIPPVDRNVMVNISLTDISPDPVFVTLLPGNGVATGPPIYDAMTVQPIFFASVRSPQDQPYTLVVSSFNDTTFRLQVKSEWSPFYDVANYAVEGVFVILLGAGGFYYYRGISPREELEAAVVSEFQNKGE